MQRQLICDILHGNDCRVATYDGGQQMALVLDPAHTRVILHGITWATFERLLMDRGDSAAPRLAYDQGTVECTIPSPEHEWLKGTLTQIVDAIALDRVV